MKQPEPPGKTLYLAAVGNDLEGVKAALERDRNAVHTRSAFRNTPLHEAATLGYVQLAEFLIDHGANTDDENEAGETPLWSAAQMNRAAVAKVLLSNSANPEHRSKIGLSPLSIAAIRGHVDVMKVLVEHGVDIHAKSDANRTVLHHATQYKQYEAVKYLIAKGADANCQDNIGNTPLHYLVGGWINDPGLETEAEVNIAKLLLTAKADIHTLNQVGGSPLQLAKGQSKLRPRICQLLQSSQ